MAIGDEDRPDEAGRPDRDPVDHDAGDAIDHPVDQDTRDSLFIDGRWEAATSADRIEVVDPTTERRLGTVPMAEDRAVDRAVAAAARAFPGWAATSPADRAAILTRFADSLEGRAETVTRMIAREVGSPLPFSRTTQVGLPIAVLRSMVEVLGSFPFEEIIDRALVVHEPAGVVAAITPWNYPLHQAVAKVSAAMAAGCTVILKPSGVAPLTAFVLADIADEVGLPPGVFNVVSGHGSAVGERLAGHPSVDVVSLTGSNAAGQRVMELAAPSAKRVTLELGGKSATVILDDVDLATVIPDAVVQCFRNTGQNCSALSRLIVPRRWLTEVERMAVAAAEAVVVGDPFAPTTAMGPLVSAVQREVVRDLIRVGSDEGARMLTGGPEAPDGLTEGFFVRPTIFSDVGPAMRIAQEEIFGPVLSILAYEDGDDEAVTLANDSRYGLSGAVWSADPLRAERVARRMRTGRVVINGGPFNARAPFGGYKGSGIGRELGRYGMAEYLEVKTLQR